MDQQNSEPQQDIGQLFERATDDSLLVDELLNETDEPQRQEPAQPQQRPAQPQQRVSGYEPLIRAKRAKISELYKRLEMFDQEGSPYVTEGTNGERQYNHAAFQRDQIALQKAKDELADLERKRNDTERVGQQNSQQARKLARALLEREVAKLPKEMHQDVVQLYGQYFSYLEKQGQFSKNEYADPAHLRNALTELLDGAIGKVARQRLSKSAAPATNPGGGEELEDEGRPHDPQGESEKDDDFTNNVMYAYEQRRANRGKTIGQVRREERDRLAKGGER